MDWMHPYEKLPLFGTGMFLAVCLIGTHLAMLLKPEPIQSFLKVFPRNNQWGQILLGIGLAWFWLLVAPEGHGLVSSLAMDLGEFNNAKPLLRILVPVSLILVSMSVRDFLAVRALGLLGLMAAAPLLGAAFLKNPDTRLLIPIYTYVLITVSLFWVGMPFLFRDAVTWVTADQKRWKAASMGGLAYGVIMFICALAFWRGY
ncbi:hypothetical protein JIN85_08925 [Luteolibacter pohnpeiensis]|uniref:Uncharacterized protein n=1 Tax=Luteolibacter pohnpeiensis TaxID=454153 RepID=A0A934SAA6_9BACT|nr:hypothetical protein [Luteolibacter pohnpeiensis]MBK1882537.1 hypothetical protein [Luteolibacter pohnpeiensis]